MNQNLSPRRRALSLLLALSLILGLLPGPALAAETEDGAPAAAASAGHWASGYLNQLVEWGFIRADQAQDPDRALTRADFMSIVNRAYGYHEVGPTPFEDVSEYDWFYDDVGIAYTAQYIKGTSPTTASPNDTLDRETAATILGRNMMLQESPGEILDFSDARNISNWARGTIKSSMEHYLVSGYDDGTFRPQQAMNWGEIAALVTRTIGTPLQDEGDYSLGGVFGNVTVTSPGVTLRDTVISGDLYITGGVGLGGIKLENVTVLGRIIASGTGASEGGASILMRNVTADELLIDNLQDKEVSVQADGITEIGKTTVRSSAYIEDNTPDGLGLHQISFEGDYYGEDEEAPEGWEPPQLTLAGRIEEVVNRTPEATVHAAKGTVAKLTVDETATDSHVVIDRGALVKDLVLDTAVDVAGEGDITRLEVNAPGCDVEMLPDEIVIRPGITAIIAGEEMDSVSADEFLLDPMILSGYPKAQDIAPTSLEAVFATNKKGRIYWAVSAITDGSIGADDLIKPPAYGNKAVKWGTLDSPRGNEETTAQITGLQPDGSYYLSAVLEDAKGQLSPVKVISFTTPDNTVPAFNTGYPYMSKVSRTDSVVVVSPNKDCKLYYALLPQGATAPTENELKTSAVAGALGYGVRDVQKNVEDTFRVNDVILDEVTTYVLYLWLEDADGANKSAISSLTFTTDDETPPEFIIDPSADTATVQATSVGLTFRLNENGTVYWVAVPAGTPYPLPQPGTEYATAPLTSDYAKIQVSSGLGIGSSGKSGRVTATENVDGTITVSGLLPETYYDFYYVAKDNAGADRNYSVTVKKITIHTLDASAPIVKQSFSPASETGSPKVTSEIYIDFSEDVIFIGDGSNNRSLLDLQKDVDTASGDAKTQAQNRLANALFNGVRLLKYPLGGTEPEKGLEAGDHKTRAGQEFTNDMLVDYTAAVVEDLRSKSGVVRVRFPSSATHLVSGGQYCFIITDFVDSSQNELVPKTINFMDPASRKSAIDVGHDVDYFIVDFASAKLARLTVQDNLPYQRENGAITTNEAEVDRAFTMKPDSTSVVDPLYAYDLALWTNRPIEYDLYYRIRDSKNDDNWVTQEKIGEYADNLLNKSNQSVDAHGWMYLGNSGTHFNSFTDDDPAKYQWAGKSVGFTFSKLDQTKKNDYPKLIKMAEGLTYEFAISLTKWDHKENRDEWTGKTLVQVHVDTGISESLCTLGGTIQNMTDLRSAWQEALAAGINEGMMEIGSAPPEKYLELTITRDDTSVPKFAEDYPVLSPTSTKVDMDLALTTQGTIYWAIAEVTNGVSDVTTTVSENGTDRNIRPEEVPKTWPAIGAGEVPIDQPTLSAPAFSIVMSPLSSTRFVGHGQIEYKDSVVPPAEQLLPSVDLTPNTTYYVYFVLKGPKSEPSDVYIYQFTTKKSPKPQINIRDNRNSSVNIWTEDKISSNYWYLVCTENNMEAIEFLSQPFANVLDSTGDYIPRGQTIPSYYSNLTVLGALKQEYNYDNAFSQSSNANAYYPSTGTPAEGSDWVMGASVFDIYANAGIREQVDTLVRSASTGSAGVDAQNVFTDGNGRTTAGRETPQNIRDRFNNEIGSGNYVILVVAQNTQKFNNDPPTNGGKDGFKAAVIRQSDDSTPRLIGATMGDITATIEKDEAKAPFSGTIQLTFNTNLYHKDDLVLMNSSNFEVSLPSGTGTASINPSVSGPTSTFYLQFTGYNGRATMTSETTKFLVNSSNGGAKLDLYVTAAQGTDKEQSTDIDGKPITISRPYIQFTVYWGHPTADSKHEDYNAIPLDKIYLDELSGGSTTPVTGIEVQDDDKTKVTNVTLTSSAPSKRLYAILAPATGTESVHVTWTPNPTGIISKTAGNSSEQRVTITGEKVGKTTVRAEADASSGIPESTTFSVTVQGKLSNPRLTSNDTSAVTGGTNNTYTWTRADAKSHSATLAVNTGFPVDASEIDVSVNNSDVKIGGVSLSGSQISIPLTWDGETGNVTVTVKGKTGAYWESPDPLEINITLAGQDPALAVPTLTPNGDNSSFSELSAGTGANANTYTSTWTSTNTSSHEAELRFSTTVEVEKSAVKVTSDKSSLVRVEESRLTVNKDVITVPLTYLVPNVSASDNTATVTITLTVGGKTETKKIVFTLVKPSDSGGTIGGNTPTIPIF